MSTIRKSHQRFSIIQDSQRFDRYALASSAVDEVESSPKRRGRPKRLDADESPEFIEDNAPGLPRVSCADSLTIMRADDCIFITRILPCSLAHSSRPWSDPSRWVG